MESGSIRLDFSEGLVAVKQNGKWGYINTTGKQDVAAIYEEVHQFFKRFGAVKRPAYGVLLIKTAGWQSARPTTMRKLFQMDWQRWR